MKDNVTQTSLVGQIYQPADKGAYLGASNGAVAFTAPIDLLPDDRVIIDPRSGQPLAVYREGRNIWQFEGESYTGSFSGRIDPKSLAALLDTIGVNHEG